MFTSVLVAVFSVLLLHKLLTSIYPLQPSKNRSTVPGMSPSHSKRGNLNDITKAGSLHQFLLELHRKYGSIASYWMGEKYTVSIASAELFKEHHEASHRPVDLLKLFEPLETKESLAFVSDEEGKRRRAIYDPFFSHKTVTEEYLPTIHRISNEILEKISKYPEFEHVPVVEHMFIYSVRCVTECVLGDHFRNYENLLHFKESFEYCVSELEKRLDDTLPGIETDKKFETERQNLWDIVREAINKREAGKEDGNLLVDALLRKEPRRDVLEADLVTIVLTGVHTTAYALAWALYYLSQDVDVEERCFKELKNVLGEDDLDARVINDLKYLKQVIDETLRCSTVAPYAGREMGKTTGGTLGGHKIPPETTIMHALGVAHHDENVWPDPTRFDPERFANEPAPYTFEPFGFAGNRKCLGYRFSYLEIQIMLSKFLRKFKVKLVPGQKIEKDYGIVTKPKDEIYLTLEKRCR